MNPTDESYPRYPLYIPTKGRHEFLMTSKALTGMGVHHHLIVEDQEVDAYQAAINETGVSATIVPLDMRYKREYELCDDLGLSRSTGPGPARNAAWAHSMENGHAWHWVMDDNIRYFVRLNKNLKIKCKTPGFWRAMEAFCERYENIAMAGPHYTMFAPRKTKLRPFLLNTRVYSCNLIRNDVPFRWRGRYNEDTILSLDMLKAGWCTVQFFAFLQEKICTQVMPGGNTDEFYLAEGKRAKGETYSDTGTLAKSQMLEDVHPDVAKVVHRFSRIHHEVNYRPFRRNKLKRKPDAEKPSDVEFGMRLKGEVKYKERKNGRT